MASTRLSDSFAEVVASQTKGRGVNVVIDLLGGSVLAGNLACARPEGTPGARRAARRNDGIARPEPHAAQAAHDRRHDPARTATRREDRGDRRGSPARSCPWLERGLVRPVVDSVFPFDEFLAAQARVESNQVFGKVILRL